MIVSICGRWRSSGALPSSTFILVQATPHSVSRLTLDRRAVDGQRGHRVLQDPLQAAFGPIAVDKGRQEHIPGNARPRIDIQDALVRHLTSFVRW